jgi:hypothetical protein
MQDFMSMFNKNGGTNPVTAPSFFSRWFGGSPQAAPSTYTPPTPTVSAYTPATAPKAAIPATRTDMGGFNMASDPYGPKLPAPYVAPAAPRANLATIMAMNAARNYAMNGSIGGGGHLR